MIELLLKIFVISLIVMSVSMSYNAQVYHQLGIKRWITFGLTVIVSLTFGLFFFKQVSKITSIPFVGKIIEFVNNTISIFINYLPKDPLLVWFLGPFMFVCLYFLFMTIFKVVDIRKTYSRWLIKNKDKFEKSPQKETISNNDIKKDAKEDIKDDIKKDIEFNGLANDEVVLNSEAVHFLSEKVDKIRYSSVLGLRKAYETARKNGLVLGETDEGYVAVYTNSEGVNSLKKILETNDISSEGLISQPSLVFFSKDGLKCTTLKETFAQMGRGEVIE
ncbi:hypothetical protein AAK913_12515 [Enterococcus faecium]|uniref:hypothetical protein n=1 Tax=Enterococcus faecium TaxID=1352 RepID=UPI00351484C1